MATPRPAVHVAATGGSISGLGPHRLAYILYPELGQRLSIEAMLARIPEAHDIAEIQAEYLIRMAKEELVAKISIVRKNIEQPRYTDIETIQLTFPLCCFDQRSCWCPRNTL